MRLPGRTKVGVDSEMDLHGPALEPCPTAFGELRRFRDLGDPEEPGVEFPRFRLPACRHCELHLLDPDDRHSAYEPIPQAATRSAWRRTGRARGSSAVSSPTG